MTELDVRAVREAWATELEQTDMLQGTRAMRYVDLEGNTRQCCLGILCNILMPDEWRDWGVTSPEFGRSQEFVIDESSTAIPPDSVLVAAGLSDSAPAEDQCSVWKFVTMNDTLHLTFKEIAAEVRALNDEVASES